MTDDDELVDRLRDTLARAAEGRPVPPPPPLPAATPRHRPRWLAPLAAAAAVAVAVAVGVAALAGDGGERVDTGPAGPPTTTGGGGDRGFGTDGDLAVTVTARPSGSAPGVVAVDVLIDRASAPLAEVAVTGDGIAPAGSTFDPCAVGTPVRRLGYSVGATGTGGPTTVTVRVTAGGCGGGPAEEVAVAVDVPDPGILAGDDGPSSPTVDVALGVPDEGRLTGEVAAGGVDGCIEEVLVDWGDRTTEPTILAPTDACGRLDPTAVEHLYAPGEYVARVTVTTHGGQVAFVEREVIVEP